MKCGTNTAAEEGHAKTRVVQHIFIFSPPLAGRARPGDDDPDRGPDRANGYGSWWPARCDAWCEGAGGKCDDNETVNMVRRCCDDDGKKKVRNDKPKKI